MDKNDKSHISRNRCGRRNTVGNNLKKYGSNKPNVCSLIRFCVYVNYVNYLCKLKIRLYFNIQCGDYRYSIFGFV